MTGDSGSPPDRPAPARPVRVARFDGFSDVDDVAGRAADDARAVDPEAAEQGHRVADLGGLAGARSEARIVEFDELDASRAAPVAVVHLDTVARRARTRPVDNPVDADQERSDRPTPSADASDGDGVPPDGPLPRGRRRRGGRLEPDAPDPDEPQPEADPVAVAREICLRLLTERSRTRQELAQALARKGVPAEAAVTVLERFDEVGLIDDAAFAGQWVRSRHAHRGLGRRAIAVELRRKGVADDVAREALTEVDADAEARRARELVDRKLRSLRVDTPEHRASAVRRLVGMLARKGYGAGTAYAVVREALAEHGADAEELGVEPPE